MIHYGSWRLVCLEKIDTMNFGGRDNLVSEVLRRGIRKKYGSTTTTTVSELLSKTNVKRGIGNLTWTSISQIENQHQRIHC